MLYPSWLK